MVFDGVGRPIVAVGVGLVVGDDGSEEGDGIVAFAEPKRNAHGAHLKHFARTARREHNREYLKWAGHYVPFIDLLL